MSLIRIIPFILLAAATVVSAQPAVTFTIDAQRDVHPISRFIYGVNRTLDGAYANLPFTRVGGNRWTAYNWVNNASNAGSDWQFQNDSFLGGGDAPGGAMAKPLKNAADHNAGIIITIPICGYVSADKNGGGDVRKSGANYLQTRFRPMLAAKGAAFTLTPDPKSPTVYADELVNWIKANYAHGFTGDARPIYFALDNEPDLWSSTHAQIHPKPAGYDELVQKTIEYSKAIKAVAPKSLIFGPVNYGWQGFVRLQNAPDAKDRDFQEYYLQQLAQAEKTAGKRLLDVLDVHWYPEARGGGARIVEQKNAEATVAARVQAPRSLWDKTYKEESWITKDVLHDAIQLLPRLRDKIDKNYKGTKLAVTEYNYGGGNHISGAIAEADVLGIFGREGIFAACEWPMAKDESFIAGGLKMYRDFDGRNAAFGDTSISAASDNAADSSVYASLDSANPKRMVLIAINKTDHALAAHIRLENTKPHARGDVYQLTSAAPEPKPAGNIVIQNPKSFDYTMPAWSVSTVCLTAP